MNERREYREDTIDLVELFHVLLRKWWLILLCFIIGVVSAGAVTKYLITPQYQASSMLYVLTKTTSVTSLADIQMGTQLTSDFKVIATSRPVIEDAMADVEAETGTSYSYNEFLNHVAVDNPSNTRILKITVTHEVPKLAQVMADAVAAQTATHMAQIMSTDAPTTVENAVVPTSPSSPSLTKNCAMGGLLGIVLICALLIILHLTDTSIRSEEDIARYLGLDTLVVLPYDADLVKNEELLNKKKKK